jgi:long-chain acyl-CoA synthetase
MVALWAPNSPEWVVAYFGIVCAGAAAIPLDHQSTVQGVAAPLVHATPRLLLTTAAHHEEVQAHSDIHLAETLLLDGPTDAPSGWEQLRAATAGELQDVAATQLASLLYTSGTTGTPKAVPLTHANLAGNASGLLAADLIDSADRVLLPLPLHHTYPFTAGLLTALGAGATVVFPAGISGPEISRAAAAARSTTLLAVPRLCSALWDSVLAGVRSRGQPAVTIFFALLALSRGVRRMTGLLVGKWLFRTVHAHLGRQLKLIGCGGAKLPYELTWQLEALGWTVLTGYGLTETSPVLTFNDRSHSRLGSEGQPLPGVQLQILPQRDGRHGEILVRGPNVFSGYWNNPSATAAAFADGWFRTGDLGWQDADGYLYVVGRSKELIVLPDGKKLFAETVEKIYAESVFVREIGIFEHEGGLAAVFVLDEQALRERGTLRESALLREALEDIAAQLPPYQRIGAYRVIHAALPRTQLGKLKRHLLPALFADAQAGEDAREAAAPSEEDRRLLGGARAGAVWQWLNERHADRNISLDTSPQLDLQIDSLQWVALTIELEQRFHIALGGEVLSRILTVRDLLREVEAAALSTADTTAQLPPFEPPGRVLRAVGAVILFALRPIVRVAFRLQITGAKRLPTDRPLLITPNHASYLDPLVIAAALPWRQLRKTYWAGWVGVLHTSALRRFLSRAMQVFPIDPDRDLATAVRTAQQLLQRGYSVIWFPEGRRSPTGELERFQSGIGLLLHGGATAVPTAIHGTFAAWPRQRKLPRLLQLGVTFGDALTFARTTSGDADERIRTEIEAAVRSLIGNTA